MSDERRRLELDVVAERARATTLETGGHAPTVLLEGTSNTAAAQLAELAPSFDLRQRQMFVLGAMIAREAPIGSLQQAFFISEGWMSLAEGGQMPERRPADDPKRQEVLIVSALDVIQEVNRSRIYGMRRDRKGKLRDVMPLHQHESAEAQWDAPLLTMLALGFLGGLKD